MKKFALVALAAIVTTLSLTSVASAESRNRGGNEWRHQDRQHNDRRGNDWRRNDGRHDGWRQHSWRKNGWRHNGWRRGYWGGPRVVISPSFGDYCFVKKVRRYDNWGNAYIKRVRICR